jgi:hypothetical protein
MKVLMHDGHVLTLPFTLGGRPEGTFDFLEDEGTASKGVVSELADGQLRALVSKGAARENGALATSAELMRDLRFIHRSLIDITEGAEVGIESTRRGYKLLIPEAVHAPRERVGKGDRCAFNGRVRPLVLVNARGVVESVKGDMASVKLDEGDRQRIYRATGKEQPALGRAPLSLLDKVTDGE